ncbi:hypothetical protein AB0A77_18280 [Streptomyces varsoviensis]|uniref:hypothetical protein n=1 Tax=Streptomyces varsoviensis TaxID=67373 RepID=UPI0033D9A8CC
MRSTARTELPRPMVEQGVNGILLVPKAAPRGTLDETSDGPDLPPGSLAYPPCRCAQCRAGKGQPDTSVRLYANGLRSGSER